MRRARWLATGAVLGVLGYRRLDRAAKSLADSFDPVLAARQPRVEPRTGPALRSIAGHTVRGTGWLIRQARNRRSAAGGSAAGGSAGVAGFIGDIRAGMDEYLDRHQADIDRQYRRSGNTLIGQRATDRAAIPGGPVAPAFRQRQHHETKDGR